MDVFDLWPLLGRGLRELARIVFLVGYLVAPGATTAFVSYEAVAHGDRVARRIEAVLTPVVKSYTKQVQAEMTPAAKPHTPTPR
jgi:hypothetical protein